MVVALRICHVCLWCVRQNLVYGACNRLCLLHDGVQLQAALNYPIQRPYSKVQIQKYKPCSIRIPAGLVRLSVDWQTVHSVLPGLCSWIRQHTWHRCVHNPSCIRSSSSCWRRQWVPEKWRRGRLRSLTWTARIWPRCKWTWSSLILRRPAECQPTPHSAGNRAALLVWYGSVATVEHP